MPKSYAIADSLRGQALWLEFRAQANKRADAIEVGRVRRAFARDFGLLALLLMELSLKSEGETAIRYAAEGRMLAETAEKLGRGP